MLISDHPSGRMMNSNTDDQISQSSKHQGSASMIMQGREKYGPNQNRTSSSIINHRGASHHLMSSTRGSIGGHSGIMRYPYERPSNSNGQSDEVKVDQNQIINQFDKFYQHSSYIISRPSSTTSIKVNTRHPQSLIRTTGVIKPTYNPQQQQQQTPSSQSSTFSRSSLDRNSFIPTPIRHQSHPSLSRHSTTPSAFQPHSISSLPRSNTSSHHQETQPFSNPNTPVHSTNRITASSSRTTQPHPSSSLSPSFRTVDHSQSSQSPIGSSSNKLVTSRPSSSHHSSLFPTPMSTNIINPNNANKLHSHFSSPPNRLANSPPSPHQQQKHYQMSPPFAPSSHQHSHQHHHPGPTLPPLRPIHSSQAANPQSRHLLPSPSNSSRHHSQSISPVIPPRLPPSNSLEDPAYQTSSSSRRRSSLVPWSRSNQSEDLAPHHQARHDPYTSQALKRTASRAELDRPQSNLSPPSPLLAPFDRRHSPHINQNSTSQADFSDRNQSASSNNRAPTMEEETEATEEVSVKPEYLTPHLPPQQLPTPLGNAQRTSPQHSDASSCRSSITSDPEGHSARRWHGSHQVDRHQPSSNLAKKRRVTITDDRPPGRNHDSQSPHTLAPLTISTSPRQPRSNSSNDHGGSNNNDPVSPLVIGFTQPHNADAMQQMANTIKLRDEQKRLIEQRRNSFAGPASNAFPGSLTLPARSSGTGMPPPTNHPHIHGRSPPGGPYARSGSHRGSISKTTSHPSNGHPKPLSNSSVAHHHHHHHPGHPPVINLKPISEAAHSKPQQSQSQRPYISGPQTSSGYSPTYENGLCVDPSVDSPNSTIASRRGQAAREKVKNLAITPHAFRPHVMLQPSIKSAPIRSGFLQATAPNGDVVKTPLIARTNLASSTNGVQQHNTPQHQPNSSAHPLRSSHGPSSHHQSNPQSGQNGAPPDGLGRRMTMHAGVPLQVPTLTHVPMFNSKSMSNLNHGRVNGHASSYGNSVSLMSGPRTAMPSFGGPSMQQQLESSRLRGGGGGSSHGAIHSPAYHPYPPPNSHSHQSPPEPHHSSQQPRPSIGSHSSGPTISSSNQIPPKQMFLQLFDTFYDSLADSRILQSNLEEQIRRSAQLLGLLQQSSTVFEKMLDERVGAVQAEYTRDLQILESRLDRLEAEKEKRGDEEGDRAEEAELEASKPVGSPPPPKQAGSGDHDGTGHGTTAGARLERLEREIPTLRKDGSDKSNQTSTSYYYSNSRSGFARQTPLPPQPADEIPTAKKPASSESTRPTSDHTDAAT